MILICHADIGCANGDYFVTDRQKSRDLEPCEGGMLRDLEPCEGAYLEIWNYAKGHARRYEMMQRGMHKTEKAKAKRK